ncbi:hypothetical protein BABINDRAFT_119740 [Babjeviella inositovora NRRL Y-12698]|uniref:ATPase synthesis protein 25 n=1 Tax=Babjeviella inositovora NRRL Y-12698 TaxID=984486 RepID=A0A1E3QTQ4_9ASCO|nr:uncharacterized protein BABINDRAFT_119740 [Babjeviella inositovora NRRL Y-12698]ODQ81075.1 hypothetical protein BABINDRAFT_119740 [Babjeviella inositovora NRRL Y-12698]
MYSTAARKTIAVAARKVVPRGFAVPHIPHISAIYATQRFSYSATQRKIPSIDGIKGFEEIAVGISKDERLEEITREREAEISAETSTETSAERDLEEMDELDDDASPWYLRGESVSVSGLPVGEPFPVLPPDSPPSLVSVVEHLQSKLGLSDIKVFDMELADEEVGARALGDYMVVATGRSPRHLIKSATALTEFAKLEYNAVPYSEGLIKNAAMQLQHKRLQKRARKRTSSNVDDDYGVVSNSWIMVECNFDGICVNFLTKDRRVELNLEYLWCSKEDKAVYDVARAENFASDDIFSGVRGYHTMARRRMATTAEAMDVEAESFTQMLENYAKRGDYSACSMMVKEATHVTDDHHTLLLESFVSQAKRIQSEGADASLTTEIVSQFDAVFPLSPTRVHWETRTQFLYVLHKIDPQVYPLSLVKQSLVAQQAAGTLVSMNDVTFYAAAVSGSPQFFATNEHMDLVAELKFDMVSELLESVFLVQGKDFPWNKVLASVLVQCTLQLAASGFLQPSSVSLEASATSEAVAYGKRTMDSVLRFLSSIGQLPELVQSEEFTALVLSGYASARDWRAFFQFWEIAGTYSVGIEAGEGSVIDTRPWIYMYTLVAQTGDFRACTHVLDHLYPQMRSCGVDIDDENVRAAVRKVLITLSPDLGPNSYLDIREQALN